MGCVLGSRGVGEGAEAEEPAVSKGGKVNIYYTVISIFLLKHDSCGGGGVLSELIASQILKIIWGIIFCSI